jgi:hypothetical protein
MRLLTIELQHEGPLNAEQVAALDRFSILISGTPGFVWKTFNRNQRAGQASGTYVFEDDFSAQLYSCRFALQMSALGVAQIHSQINEIDLGMHPCLYGDSNALLFSPSCGQWQHEAEDLVA